MNNIFYMFRSYQNFGDSEAVKFVCMATPEDVKVNAEYVRLCDEVVVVPGIS